MWTRYHHTFYCVRAALLGCIHTVRFSGRFSVGLPNIKSTEYVALQIICGKHNRL